MGIESQQSEGFPFSVIGFQRVFLAASIAASLKIEFVEDSILISVVLKLS
jgi:hypothetical protein